MNPSIFPEAASNPRDRDGASPAERLEQLWQRGDAPEPTAFLAQFDTVTTPQVVEVLLVDQRARWRRGERPRAEAYLASHPSVRADVEAMLDLVYGEYLLAEKLNDQPDLDEYARRFPDLADALRVQVALHRALPDANEVTPFRIPPPGETRPFPTIPGYEILGELGRGGMGVVYQARQTSLNRIVALKMVLAGMQADPEALRRFRAEAEAVAQLRHPNLVQVHDYGRGDGHAYLALEYVEGGTLTSKIAGVPQTPDFAARTVQTLAAAMQHAHTLGFVHRDLKPANVLLTADGVLKITDFGLAKWLTTGADSASDRTQTGTLLGTPAYMAPEQTGSGREIGPAADTYALGVILYQLLTGRPPFEGDSALDVLRRVQEEDPLPPSRLRLSVPRDLETICLKCLEKDPAKRYRTAAALADDLRRFHAGEPITARPVSTLERAWRWCRRNPRAAVLFATVAGLLLLILIGAPLMTVQARRSERLSQERLCVGLLEEARGLRLSRRVGQRVKALERIREAVELAHFLEMPPEFFERLRTEAIAALALTDLTEAEWFGEPTPPRRSEHAFDFDPEFRRIAVVGADGGVRLYRPAEQGRDPVLVAHLCNRTPDVSLVRSSDGRYLACIDGDGGQVWDLQATPPRLACELTPKGPAGFAEENKLFYVIGPGSGRVWLYRLPSGSLLDVLTMPAGIGRTAGHPRLPQAALSSSNRVAVFDLSTGRQMVELTCSGEVHSLCWHPDGQLLAVALHHELEIWNVARGQRWWTLDHPGGGLNAAFNPTGDLLATLGWSRRLKIWDPGSGRLLLNTPSTDAGGVFWGPEDRLNERVPESLQGPHWRLSRVVASRVYRTLVTGADGGRVGVYLSRGVSPDGRITAIGTAKGVGLMDSVTGMERHFLPGCQLPIFDAAGALIVQSSRGSMRWPLHADPADPGLVRLGPSAVFPTPFDNLSGYFLEQSGDLTTLVSALGRGGGRVWRLGPSQEVRQLYHDQPGDEDCRRAFPSYNGRLVATTSHKPRRHIKIWDVATGQLLHTLLDPVGTNQAVVFSADGRFLATSAGHFREIGTWIERTPPTGQCVDFSPDSRTFVVGRKDGTIHLFDVLTGRVFATLDDPFQDEPQYLTFSPDGTQLLVTSGVNRCIHVWDLRAMRRELADLGLDWHLPPFPERSASPPPPVRRIDLIE